MSPFLVLRQRLSQCANRHFILGGLAVFALGLACTAPGGALAADSIPQDEIVILSATAMRAALSSVQPVLVKAANGKPVRIVYGTAGETANRARSPMPYDLVILPPKPLGDLAREGLVRLDEQRPVGKVSLGVAVKAGAPKPDTSNLDALTATLRTAKSIGYADPATGATTGVYFAMLLKELKVTEALKDRQKLYSDGTTAMEALARGEIELAAGQISEATPVAGLDIVGPLPAGAAFATTYILAPAVKSDHLVAQSNIRAAMGSAPVKAALKANGFDPLD